MDGYAGSSDGKLRVGLANAIQQTTCVRSKQQSQNRHIHADGAEATRKAMVLCCGLGTQRGIGQIGHTGVELSE